MEVERWKTNFLRVLIFVSGYRKVVGIYKSFLSFSRWDFKRFGFSAGVKCRLRIWMKMLKTFVQWYSTVDSYDKLG